MLKPFENLVIEPEHFWRPSGPECSPERCQFGKSEGSLVCAACSHEIKITNDIVEMVEVDDLDQHKTDELIGNEISLDEDVIRHYLDKENWSPFTRHFVLKKISWFADYLMQDGATRPAFLGSGTAFEIGPLWRNGFRPERLLISDLNRSTLEVAKYNLAAQGLDEQVPVCLFTADMDEVPVKDRETPIVIYECLHHTPDMHATIERMLAFGYRRIYFVEPSTNWLIRFLAKRGIAQREEYSGLEPDRLDLKRLRALSREHGYNLKVRTLWELPEDYYRKLARGGSPRTERLFTKLIDAASMVGRPFKFGNFAICRLERQT